MPRPAPEPMVRPATLLSGNALADPRNRAARRMLPQLAAAERMEQLCALEAMGQVHAWRRDFQPDRLIAYAMAPTEVAGNALTAEGGAFHSRSRWFRIRFRCELTPDHARIAAFAFQVGDAVPRDAWARYGLPDEAGALD